MKPEYFIDTSVWIPYFREGGSEYGDFIDGLIGDDRAHINGIDHYGSEESAELDPAGLGRVETRPVRPGLLQVRRPKRFCPEEKKGCPFR